jgi:hypothetical protein
MANNKNKEAHHLHPSSSSFLSPSIPLPDRELGPREEEEEERERGREREP